MVNRSKFPSVAETKQLTQEETSTSKEDVKYEEITDLRTADSKTYKGSDGSMKKVITVSQRSESGSALSAQSDTPMESTDITITSSEYNGLNYATLDESDNLVTTLGWGFGYHGDNEYFAIGEFNLYDLYDYYGINADDVTSVDLLINVISGNARLKVAYDNNTSNWYPSSMESAYYRVSITEKNPANGSVSFFLCAAEDQDFVELNPSITYEIVYTPPTLECISVTTPPTKTHYVEGEDFDSAGMEVKAYYSNCTSQTISDYSITPSENLTANTTSVTITYNGKATTQNITVASLQCIAITKYPYRTIYKAGDAFDSTGLKITATYSDGSNVDVTDKCSFSPATIAESTNSITITYQGKTTSLSIDVIDSSYGSKNLSFSDYGENPKFNLTTLRGMYVQPDISIGANGKEISVSHVYDTKMPHALTELVKGMPYGWKLDAHQFMVSDVEQKQYKYIDGSGYIHVFKKIENTENRYFDVDGLGLVYDATEFKITDNQGNVLKFAGDRLTENISCYNATMKKTYVYDGQGRLERIYYGNDQSTRLQFTYNANGLLSKIAAMHNNVEKQSIQYGYSDGELVRVEKHSGNANKVIAEYVYDEQQRKLALIVDSERKTAVKISYTSTSGSVSKIANGIMTEADGNANFTEKTYLTWERTYTQTSDFKTVREIQLYNEKGVRIAVQMNGKGRIIGSYECDRQTEAFKTLSKDVGIKLIVSGTNGNKTINGEVARTFTNELTLYDNTEGLSLRREGENYVNYSLLARVNLNSLHDRVVAFLDYERGDLSYETERIELDVSAYEVWQEIAIPIEEYNNMNKITKITLRLSAPGNATVNAKICNVRYAPTIKRTIYVNPLSPIDIKDVTTFNIIDTAKTTPVINNNLNDTTYFTDSDIAKNIELLRNSYIVNGHTCYDVVCNNGERRIANVKQLQMVYTDRFTSNEVTTTLGFSPFSNFTSLSGETICRALSLSGKLTGKNQYSYPNNAYISQIFEKLTAETLDSDICNIFIIAYTPENLSLTRQYICRTITTPKKYGTISVITKSNSLSYSSGAFIYDSDLTHNSTSKLADAYGNVLSETDAYGVTVNYEYFADGSLKKQTVTDADENKITVYESEQDEQIEYSVKEFDGQISNKYTFNELVLDKTEKYDYNIIATPSGRSAYRSEEYAYDVYKEKLLSITAKENEVSKAENSMTYEDGTLSSATDGKVEYRFVRDNVNDEAEYKVKNGNDESLLLKVKETPTSQTINYYRNASTDATDTITATYNTYGKITTEKYNDETKVTYTYDNEKVSEDDVENKASGSTWQVRKVTDSYAGRTEKYDYDGGGNVRKVSVTKSDGETYAMEKVGDKASIFTVKATTFTTKTEEEGGRLKEVTNMMGNNEIPQMSKTYTYDSFGRIQRRTSDYMTTQINYSVTGKMPLSESHTRSNSSVLQRAYTYDNRGNVTSNGTSTYEYDALNRLVKETKDEVVSNYAYDNSGRITNFKGNACAYDERGRLITFGNTSLSYDNYGNRTSKGSTTYTWTRGRLLSSVGNNTYEYDYRGIRTKKNGTVYFYDGNKLQIEEGPNGPIKYFYDDSGICGFMYNGFYYEYVKNIFGDVEKIYLNSLCCARYSYDAWGNCTTEQNIDNIGNINPIRYRGYYYDTETGLYYLQTRYYDPTVGQFISPDTFDYLEPETIGGVNLYAYCLNNPVMYADPSGHFSVGTFLISLVVGSLVSWGLSELFGAQIAGGISSIAGGGSAIATGISLLSFGPIGWIIGGIGIVSGIVSIAFGTAEIQEAIGYGNWINDIGITGNLYSGLYMGANIVSSLATIGGNVYRSSRISYGIGKAGKSSIAYSRYYQMEGNRVKSITHYGNGGLPKYRIDVRGDMHFIKSIGKYALPHLHPTEINNGYFKWVDPRNIAYWLWLLFGNWR